MADAMDTLKDILGDGAEDKIKTAMNMLSSSSEQKGDNGIGELMQMREIANKITSAHSDPRTNLLNSLKPYMRDERQKSIDNAIKFLNIAKFAQMFKF